MICAGCHFENASETLQCEKCGHRLFKGKIRIIQENGANTTHYLFDKNYRIGRSKENDVVIADESISRFHAELSYDDGAFSIHDLESKNGSLINNFSFKSSVLRHQDCIQLGNVLIQFYDDDQPQADVRQLDTMAFVQQEYFKLAERRHNKITTQDVLHTVLELMVSLVDGDKAAILQIVKPSKLKYKLGIGFQNGQAEINSVLKSDYALFEQALRSRETQIEWNDQVNRLEDTGTASGPFSWQRIAFPLLATISESENGEPHKEGKPLGICYLSNGKREAPLSRRKKELMAALSQQISLALENDILQSTSLASHSLHHKLSQAVQIQNRLLPMLKSSDSGFRVVSFIEPCQTMSGDYFDIIPVSRQSIALAIGDICGKGISAALLSSTAQAAIRSQMEKTTSPTQVVANLNELFVKSSASSVFLTLFFGILDLESHLFRFVNAGHPPPIFVNKAHEIIELGGTAPPLGILESNTGTERRVQFEPGDLLLMYTDGLIESQNPEREIYGRKRFIDLIYRIFADPKAHRFNLDYLVGRIKSDLLQFTSGVGQSDDLTLIAAKRR